MAKATSSCRTCTSSLALFRRKISKMCSRLHSSDEVAEVSTAHAIRLENFPASRASIPHLQHYSSASLFCRYLVTVFAAG